MIHFTVIKMVILRVLLKSKATIWVLNARMVNQRRFHNYDNSFILYCLNKLDALIRFIDFKRKFKFGFLLDCKTLIKRPIFLIKMNQLVWNKT